MSITKEQVVCEPISFASADEKTTINGFLWKPEGEPRGIVVLVHGMAEHIARYDDFARFLASRGYLVAGHDQMGHGTSVTPEKRGVLPAFDGKDMLISDVHTLRTIAQEQAQGAPAFIFGHSMGSFTTRYYISRHAEGLSGAVLCGTGFIPPATSKAGRGFARTLARLHGEGYRSKALHQMAEGGYNKKIENPRTDLDWLSYSEENVDRYIADDMCGFMFDAGGYATLTDLTATVCDKSCAEAVPSDLPLLYIAGDADPVGDNGTGVHKAAKLMRDAGSTDVTVSIYEHMRHEILNEDEHQKVYDDVRDWLESKRAEA